MNFPMVFLAMIIDRYLPLSQWITQLTAHPVVWQGKLIEILEVYLNKTSFTSSERRGGGVIMLIVLLNATLVISVILVLLIRLIPYAWIIEAVIASILLAHRSLHMAVLGVAQGLDSSIDEGRREVSHIVGRDTMELDEHEVSRAAIESLAENSSDGIIAPLFWLAILGLPGIAIYKAINTADSMVGHKSKRYADFGWASAKLDDWVNWLPARLTAVFYALAARFDVDHQVAKSWETAKRDAPNHVSPNAGWPEAAMAGALGFGLGGPRAYGGKILDLAQMGDGRRDLNANDIRRALDLFSKMTLVALVLIGLIAWTQI